MTALKHLQYNSLDVGAGLSGETISINNDQYIIEWQMHNITKHSKMTALDIFNEYCIDNKIYYNSPQYKKLRAKFNKYIYNHYYAGVILVFKNNNLSTRTVPIYFNQDYSKQQLKDAGIQKIKQSKQKLLNLNKQKD